MKKSVLLLLAILLCLFSPAWALSYQYITPAETRDNMSNRVPMAFVDIQIEDEFNQHHLPDALATYAYPVKSDADKSKLDALLPQLKDSSEIVVIVCPRGGGGAKRAYDHLEQQGVSAERLFILKKGNRAGLIQTCSRNIKTAHRLESSEREGETKTRGHFTVRWPLLVRREILKSSRSKRRV